MLVRAAVALGFGALTVFWASPSQAGMGWAGGVYLLATGVVLLWSVSGPDSGPGRAPSKMLAAAGAVLTGTGAAVALMPSDLVFGVLAALGLGLAGAAELFSASPTAAGPCSRGTGWPPVPSGWAPRPCCRSSSTSVRTRFSGVAGGGAIIVECSGRWPA